MIDKTTFVCASCRKTKTIDLVGHVKKNGLKNCIICNEQAKNRTTRPSVKRASNNRATDRIRKDVDTYIYFVSGEGK